MAYRRYWNPLSWRIISPGIGSVNQPRFVACWREQDLVRANDRAPPLAASHGQNLARNNQKNSVSTWPLIGC
jgi:hypothetical protein